jgi:hypothetical protein
VDVLQFSGECAEAIERDGAASPLPGHANNRCNAFSRLAVFIFRRLERDLLSCMSSLTLCLSPALEHVTRLSFGANHSKGSGPATAKCLRASSFHDLPSSSFVIVVRGPRVIVLDRDHRVSFSIASCGIDPRGGPRRSPLAVSAAAQSRDRGRLSRVRRSRIA